MPQVDITAYFSIVFSSLIIMSLGFVFFTLYFYVPLATRIKLCTQFKSRGHSVYWQQWNKEEVLGSFSWLKKMQ